MSQGSNIANTAAGRRGFALRAMLIVALLWSLAPGAVRADTIRLQSGEALEGSIVDATRNTVVVRRAIGGMRQMRIRDVAEVRVDLAEGESISGAILSWADGVHRLRVGDEVVSVRAGRVLSREPYQEPERAAPPTRTGAEPDPSGETAAAPAGSPPGEAATAPPADEEAEAPAAAARPAEESTTAESAEGNATGSPADPDPALGSDETAADEPAADDEIAADEGSSGDSSPHARAADETAAEAVETGSPADENAVGEPAAAETSTESLPAVLNPAAESDQSAADERAAGTQVAKDANPPPDSPAAADGDASDAAEGPDAQSAWATGSIAEGIIAKSAAAREAPDDAQILAVRGSVDPVEANAAELVFKVELSRPAEQTVVLIYGTVDGTAKAGEDYESQQGILTLVPGTVTTDIRVPLIGEQPRSGDARFELFLAADPEVANVVDQHIVATIPGEN